MELIAGYLFIAAIVSAGATIDIGHKVISGRTMEPDIRFLHYTVFFVLGILTAPIFIPTMFSSKIRETFIDSLNVALFEDFNYKD